MGRFTYGTLALVTMLAAACGDDSVGVGAGGTGGTPMVEPGPTCIALCVKFTGECGAGFRTEDDCRQSCQRSLDGEYEDAKPCGEAAEDVFLCATELECQDVYDWRDKDPPDSYPCRSEVLVFDELVEDGICSRES